LMYVKASIVISHMLEINDNISIIYLCGCRFAVHS